MTICSKSLPEQAVSERWPCLKELTQLRQLHLKYTHATYLGIEKLHQALPNCKIKPRLNDVEEPKPWEPSLERP